MSKASKTGTGGEKHRKMFAGRYAYEKPLGRGAGGSVYLAEDLHADEREVALKVLSSDACETVQGKMLRREFEILSKLNHPNLVQVYDYGTLPDGGVYLAEEYIDGFSLQDARALLEPEALIDPTLQVLQGLAYLHGMGMIHRDIKPANVMLLWLDDASARPMVKLVDFGLSSMNPKRDTLRGGTRSYMAPEIIRGDKGEFRSDLYSLGVSLYYALCGVLPWGPRSKEDPPPTEEDFSPPDPHRLNEDVPLELSRFTMALLRQVPDVDYADAGEALQALSADAGELEARSVGQMANSLDISAAPVIQGYFERGILSRRVEEDDLLVEWISMTDQPSMGQMYLVRGDEGVGKSRLLHDVQASVKLSGHLVLEHECRQLDGPYSLLVEMVDRLVQLARSHGVLISESDAVALEVRRLLTQLEIVSASDSVRPFVEQSWMRSVIEEILEKLAPREVIFFIDDIDEADESSLEILYEWFRPAKSPDRPVIVATTGRGDFFRTFSGQDGVQVLPIEGVSADDVRSFFREQLGVRDLSDDWIEAVADAADGRPAYIEELCRYLIDAGMLWRQSAERWRARVDDIEAAGVPESLRESLRRRITAVGAAGRECLELLALMDRPLTWKSARTLLERGGSSSQEAEQTLLTVQWRHLVTTILTQGGRYVQVIHRELADAVADMISPEWRRALNRRIGQQVAVDWQSGKGDALEAASHLDDGGKPDEAAPYYETAGDSAADRGQYQRAFHRYERALAGTTDTDAQAFIHLKLARVQLDRFEIDSCRRHFENALKLVEDTGGDWLRYRALLESARGELTMGNVDVARRRLDQLRGELPEMSSTIDVAVLEAIVDIRHGQFEAAEQALQRCSDQAPGMRPHRVIPVLLVWGRLQLLRGQQDEAMDSYARAMTLAEESDDHCCEGMVLTWYGTELRRLDRPVRARGMFQRALPMLVEAGPPDQLVELLFQLAWSLAELEQLDVARQRAREALSLAGHLGHRAYEQKAAVLLGGLLLKEQRGQQKAVEQLEPVVEAFDGGDDFVADRAELLMALGDLMIALQLREKGPRLLQRGRQMAFNIGARGLLPPLDE